VLSNTLATYVFCWKAQKHSADWGLVDWGFGSRARTIQTEMFIAASEGDEDVHAQFAKSVRSAHRESLTRPVAFSFVDPRDRSRHS
jgi:hypothetical protein